MDVRLARLPGRLRAARDQATSCRRCRLAWAAVLSLSLHVGLLSTVTRPSASLSGDTLFVTVLPAQVAPVDVAARAEPPPQPAQASLRPPDVPRPSVAAAAPAPAASVAMRPSLPARAVASGPVGAAPLGSPQLRDDLRRQLVARRLLVRVSVDSAGVVTNAVFVSPELGPQVLAELVDAVSRVRFAPAQEQGRPVGGVFSARLCFDDDGVLQDGPECWIPASR